MLFQRQQVRQHLVIFMLEMIGRRMFCCFVKTISIILLHLLNRKTCTELYQTVL